MITYPESPGASAPDTSRAAARQSSGHARIIREQCLVLLQARDLTADECAEALQKSILSVRPRIAEMHAKRLIFDTGTRRKNASGHSAIVWCAHPAVKASATHTTIEVTS